MLQANHNSRIEVKMGRENGFTLVELLVAMTLALVVMAAIYSTYTSQQKTYIIQEQVSRMQQNVRAAINIMAREIRMAGYDPSDSGNFGITDVMLRDKDDNPNTAGYSSLKFTIDKDDAGTVGTVDSSETVYFCVFDSPVSAPDGSLDLAREVGGGGRQLLAENIEALAFAYAYDFDADGMLDTTGANNVIWAVDTNNDNALDLNLDTDDNGVIDENDDTNGDGTIDGIEINPQIPLTTIKAVKIWLLARTEKSISGHNNGGKYVVGHRVITPNGSYMYRLITRSVRCRNL
jgi:type IV pilus assembly protein PilW